MKLENYRDWTSKDGFFKQSSFKIDTKDKFDTIYKQFPPANSQNARTSMIFRGMKEAKHKLFSSSQRLWIQNDMREWVADEYLGFIDKTVQKAKENTLLKKVFDLYKYSDADREFPILSILQHYGAPTPLMDWTYNINVALFFATENLITGNGTEGIDNYFSIYFMFKPDYQNVFLNLTDIHDKKEYPKIIDFKGWGSNHANQHENGCFYISDFEYGNTSTKVQRSTIRVRNKKPLSLIYNQNIVSQEGLFIFNPYPDKPLEDIFNVGLFGEYIGEHPAPLRKFRCYNIKKDLAEYIRRKIKKSLDIDHAFIYPELKDEAKAIKDNALNHYAV